jgi:alkylation response protein AidB-like acyl-CoA dehydrogenase
MDFQLSEDQRAFADMAQGLFNDYCSDDQLRAHDLSARRFDAGPVAASAWPRASMASWSPETHGGLGLGMTELMAVLEQQGRALALVPLWEHQLVAAAVARFAPEAADTLLPAAMAGELLALSLDGPERQPRPWRCRLRADGGGCTAACRRCRWPHAVGGGAAAGAYARRAAAAGAANLDASGRKVSSVETASASTTWRWPTCTADTACCSTPPCCRAEALAWLEPRAIAGAGRTAARRQRPGRCARTVDYVSERKQFERPIGSFQLVAGQMADAQIAIEALRSALWQLVYRLDAGLPAAAPQALRSPVPWPRAAGHRVGHKAQHVHGGMGVDLTYPIHRYLYWSRALAWPSAAAEQALARAGRLARRQRQRWAGSTTCPKTLPGTPP